MRAERSEEGTTATVFGAGTRTRLEYAALINATMVRYLDYNDTFVSEGRACHPSDQIPALVSVAEAEGSTGEELLEAIVVAYEIEGAGLDTGATWDHGYDYVTWGAFSTVAAAGRLMRLDREALVNALGIAGASNLTLSVSRKGVVSMWKGVAHPYTSHNAIQACQMAREGMTGPVEVFEGPGGFFDVAAGRELTVEALGGRNCANFRINRAHIKSFPCGYYMQPMITGLRDLVAEHDVDLNAIEAIEIETFEQAATILGGDEKWSADLTRESADHSIPYTAALAVVYGNVTPDHYERRYRTDPELHRLVQLVSVEESQAMNAAARDKPNSTPSIVRIRTRHRTLECRVDYAPGHAENPLSHERLRAKFRSMAGPLLTEAAIHEVNAFCNELPEHSDVDRLLAALTI
jgi:2-methylcitrate dehydratase